MGDGAVVVVGGTRGIGLELVRHYADAGREVVLHGTAFTASALSASAVASPIPADAPQTIAVRP